MFQQDRYIRCSNLKFKNSYEVSDVGDLFPVDDLRDVEIGVGLLEPGMTSVVDVQHEI